MGLFSNIFGDKSLVDLDSKVDDLINTIPTKLNRSTTEDTTGKIINSFIQHSGEDEVAKLFQNVSIPHDRAARYALYEEISKAVPIIKRILKVYIANLLPKNPVDGKCIIYRDTDASKNDEDDMGNKAKTFAKDIVDQFDIVNKLKTTVIPRRLLYGDCFVEVVDVNKEAEKIDLNKGITYLGESVAFEKSTAQTAKLLEEEVNRSAIGNGQLDYLLSRLSDCLVQYESYSPEIVLHLNEQQIVEDNHDDGKKDDVSDNFSDILVKVHRPNNIIILDTKYGTRIGYLEVMSQDSITSQNISQSLAKTIGKITNLGKTNEIAPDKLVNKLIYHVLKKIIGKVQTPGSNIGRDVDGIVRSLGEDVYTFIKRMFIEQGIYKKNNQFAPMKVRFIPPDRMVQFSNPSLDYTPYGESVAESLILPCKLYMLAQLANTITKLSRASLIRTWRLDVGSSQMHSQLIQKLKRELYNTRVTLDDLSSFKSIPKVLSDFKDMFILTKQGQSPVDVSVQSMGDASINN